MMARRVLLTFGLANCGLALFDLTLAAVSPASAESDNHARSMKFEDCLGVIHAAADHLGIVPVDVADTALLRIVRFPVSDGSVVVICSRADEKIVVTKTDDRCGAEVEC